MVTYQDNNVSFDTQSTTDKLASATFTVKALKITDGQDPSNLNRVGDVHTGTGQNSVMAFKVGRKGSSAVANWWNSNIKDSQNTFDHTADELNFAFLGTLELAFADSDRTRHYTFYDIGLAQGHSTGGNNWWFGGKNCTYSSTSSVTTKATDDSGTVITFEFFRGALNSNEEITVTRKLT